MSDATKIGSGQFQRLKFSAFQCFRIMLRLVVICNIK